MAKNDLLIAWLSDAYAMEKSQQEMLERFVKAFRPFPDIRPRVEQHIEKAKAYAAEIKDCVERMGGKVSSTKSILGNIAGAVQGMSTAPYKDEPIKNILLWHAGAHFGHAAHTALAAGARACGENEVATNCERIAQEAKLTADWTEQQIPVVVAAVMEAQGEQGMAP